MNIELRDALKVAEQRQEARKRRRKEKSQYSRSYCIESEFNVISSNTYTSTESCEANNASLSIETVVNNTMNIDFSNRNDTIEPLNEPEASNDSEEHTIDYSSSSEEICDEDLNQPIEFLHHYTDVSTHDFCYRLIRMFRDLHICKSKYRKFIQLIQSILPNPNNLPSSMDLLLSMFNINDNIFTKRKVCLLCENDIAGNLPFCSNCPTSTETNMAIIYDSDVSNLLFLLITRVWAEMMDYKKIIWKNNDIYNTKDIPFGDVYQDLRRRYSNESFITGLLHLDGVSPFQSSKLKIWLFSFSLIELPANIRYRRFNMPIISIWVSYAEPNTSLWLKSSITTLETLKVTGIVTFFL